MRSSFALELEVLNKLRDAGIECEHIGGPGDMGIDIKGVACSIPFVVQCKNWRKKIEAGFAPSAWTAANTSIFDIVLTDVANIIEDLSLVA
ncbi:5480_t:CDS:2, partial [Entrophospora sp. SA101]